MAWFNWYAGDNVINTGEEINKRVPFSSAPLFEVRQFFMIAAVNDLAVVHDKDLIGISDVLNRWAMAKLVRLAVAKPPVQSISCQLFFAES